MYMNYTIVYMHKLVHILPTSSEWMPTNNLHVWDGINQQSGFQREGRDGGDGDGGGAAVVDWERPGAEPQSRKGNIRVWAMGWDGSGYKWPGGLAWRKIQLISPLWGKKIRKVKSAESKLKLDVNLDFVHGVVVAYGCPWVTHSWCKNTSTLCIFCILV